MPDSTAPKQLPFQMPQPPMWALSLPPGTGCQGKVKHRQTNHSLQLWPSPSPQSCQPGTDGTISLFQLQPGGVQRRRVFPHPKLSSACGRGGGAIVVESWQRQPAAAGRVEKMISNPEKCRPDGGPESALGGEKEGEKKGGREGAPQAEKGRGARERTQELFLRKLRTILSFLSLSTNIYQGPTKRRAQCQALGR